MHETTNPSGLLADSFCAPDCGAISGMGSRDTEPSDECGGCRDRTDRKDRQGNGRRRGHPPGNRPQGGLQCRRALPHGQHGKGGCCGKDPRHGGQGADQADIAYTGGALGAGAGRPVGRYPVAPRAFIHCFRPPRAHDHEERQHFNRCSLSGSRRTDSRPCVSASPGFEGNRILPDISGSCCATSCQSLLRHRRRYPWRISSGGCRPSRLQSAAQRPTGPILHTMPTREIRQHQMQCWGS